MYNTLEHKVKHFQLVMEHSIKDNPPNVKLMNSLPTDLFFIV